jgi:hypothetical protein
MNDNDAKPEAPELRVRSHYIKSPSFRTIHADGMFGGATPGGVISMALFSERQPIPTEIVHRVDNGELVELPDARVTRDGTVREIEVNAVMSLTTAKALRRWLDTHIDQLEKLLTLAGKL